MSLTEPRTFVPLSLSLSFFRIYFTHAVRQFDDEKKEKKEIHIFRDKSLSKATRRSQLGGLTMPANNKQNVILNVSDNARRRVLFN